MPGRILIVDDEADMCTLLERIIGEDTDHQVVKCTNPLDALEIFKKESFDLAILDLKMPKMDGLRLLEEMKKLNPKITVVILTAHATVETAVSGIKKGAFDYISKPFRRERLLLTIDKAMSWQKVVLENQALRQALESKGGAAPLVGNTPGMRKIYERIRQVAPTGATVLITGASGTGKELVARAIHDNSQRSNKKFVTINSTAIPEQVIESELFGHVKGAFTGAWKSKTGLVEEAHEGTLFLDEIGDLNPTLQTKLLRLLQEGEYKPVGSEITRKADLRFIAATNQNLRQAIKEKTFREDLYYRLNVISFELPTLKERVDDIPLLLNHFTKKYASLYQKEIQGATHEAMRALMNHDFPGNVRELENTIERAVIFNTSGVIGLGDLFLEAEPLEEDEEISPELYNMPFREAKLRLLEVFHSRYIENLLRENHGNVSKASEVAGIQRQYLHRLMKEAGINPDDYRPGSI